MSSGRWLLVIINPAGGVHMPIREVILQGNFGATDRDRGARSPVGRWFPTPRDLAPRPRFWAHSRVRSPVLGSLQGHVPGPLPGSGASSWVGSAVPPGRGASSRVWGASSRPGSGPGSEPKTGGGEPAPGGWGTTSPGSALPGPGPRPRNYLPDWHALSASRIYYQQRPDDIAKFTRDL